MAQAILQPKHLSFGSIVEPETNVTRVPDEELFEFAFLLIDALILAPLPPTNCVADADLLLSDVERHLTTD